RGSDPIWDRWDGSAIGGGNGMGSIACLASGYWIFKSAGQVEDITLFR
ncbi:MAG: hypothetical protein JWM04_157, partial [Verrucomicrobiales bacterium]|nr:hypothetical protein [Verrucomicrobiales bacterium]